MAKVKVYEVDVQSMNGSRASYFGTSLSQALDFADPDFRSIRIHSYVVGHIQAMELLEEAHND